MLPAEILALVFVASSAHAFPQSGQRFTANFTSSPAQTTPAPEGTSGGKTSHGEITAPGLSSESSTEECLPPTCGMTWDCFPPTCGIIPVQISVPTATGFEDTTTEGKPTASITARPTLQPSVTTSQPTIINVIVHTSVAPASAVLPSSNANVEPPLPSERTWEQDGPTAPEPTQDAPSAFEPTASEGLLTDILGIIVQQSAQPSDPDDNQLAPGDDSPQQEQPGTADSAPNVTPAPGAQPTLKIGQSMTLGGATLTLTPGLSTTVGTGPAGTYIEIASDEAGQTMVTLSSSGTAVTATVPNAPATGTGDGSAGVTQVATSGGDDSSTAGAAASASSEAAALDRRRGTDWLGNIVMGIVGLGIVL